jgi:hypothetical protein
VGAVAVEDSVVVAAAAAAAEAGNVYLPS